MLRTNIEYNKYANKGHKKMEVLFSDKTITREEKLRSIKKILLNRLVLCKLVAQENIDIINTLRDCNRIYKKALASGALPPDIKNEVIDAIADVTSSISTGYSVLVDMGKLICDTLDLWQSSGAKITDLFNFCNAKPQQIQEVYRDRAEHERFSKIMMIYTIIIGREQKKK